MEEQYLNIKDDKLILFSDVVKEYLPIGLELYQEWFANRCKQGRNGNYGGCRFK